MAMSRKTVPSELNRRAYRRQGALYHADRLHHREARLNNLWSAPLVDIMMYF